MTTIPRHHAVRTRRFSKAEYYQMGELGFFHGERVELIEGRIMVMSPQGPLHACCVDQVARRLETLFGAQYWVRRQFPLDLGQTTEPEPDVSVVQGTLSQYLQAHPTSAVLLIEVSDTTLAHDRRRKGSLYARASIADYWIVNLVDRQVEVYRDPVADPSQPFKHRYASRTDGKIGATITPLVLPGVAVPVADLLP